MADSLIPLNEKCIFREFVYVSDDERITHIFKCKNRTQSKIVIKEFIDIVTIDQYDAELAHWHTICYKHRKKNESLFDSCVQLFMTEIPTIELDDCVSHLSSLLNFNLIYLSYMSNNKT